MISKYDPQSIGDEQRPLYNLLVAVTENPSKIPELVIYLEGADRVKEVVEGIANKKYYFKLTEYFSAYLYVVIEKYCNVPYDQATVMMVALGLTGKYRNLYGYIPQIKLFYEGKDQGLQYALKHNNPNREDMTHNIYGEWAYLKTLNLNDYVVERVEDLYLKLQQRTEDYTSSEPIIVLSNQEGDEYPSADYTRWFDEIVQNPELTVSEQMPLWIDDHKAKLSVLRDIGQSECCYAATLHYQLGEYYRFLDDYKGADHFERAFWIIIDIILNYNQYGLPKDLDFGAVLNTYCALFRERASTADIYTIQHQFQELARFINRAAGERIACFGETEELDAPTIRNEFEFVNGLWNYYRGMAQFLADLLGKRDFYFHRPTQL